MAGRKRGNGVKVPEVPITGEVIPATPGMVLDIRVDILAITWGDYKLLNGFTGVMTPQVYEFLNRVVIGGIDKLPLIGSINPIMQAISDAIEDASLKQPMGTAKTNGHKPKEPEPTNRGN